MDTEKQIVLIVGHIPNVQLPISILHALDKGEVDVHVITPEQAKENGLEELVREQTKRELQDGLMKLDAKLISEVKYVDPEKFKPKPSHKKPYKYHS